MKLSRECLILLASALAVFAGPAQPDTVPPSLWDVISGNIAKVSSEIVSPHIVGGEIAVPHRYPYQVYLYITPKAGRTTSCGGSLITPDWILSAAHCVARATSVVATLGSHQLNALENSKQKIPVSKWIMYNGNTVGTDDISLLQLEHPAALNEYVNLIHLPEKSTGSKDYTGKTIEIVGWGIYDTSMQGQSMALRVVETNVLPQYPCLASFAIGIDDRHICSDGKQGKGPCSGDSGGPMILRENEEPTLIGVLSFGNPRSCTGGSPSVFMRTDKYLDWISNNTDLAV